MESDTVRKAPRTTKSWLRLSLLFMKLLVVTICVGFIIHGWHRSVKKFSERQTSVSTIINDTADLAYPSVTFCHKFRGAMGINRKLEQLMSAKNLTLDDVDVDAAVDSISFSRTDFLTMFSHPRRGGPHNGIDALYNDSLWTETIPHQQLSGKCFTYDPPFRSEASFFLGIRFAIKLAGTGRMNQDEKERRLSRLQIYLHDKGAFTYYVLDDRPNMAMLDVSRLAFRKLTSVVLSYSRLTKLSNDQVPCESDPNYNLNECIEKSFAKLRGCQAPWTNSDNVEGLPVCSNLSVWSTKGLRGSSTNDDYFRHRLSNWAVSRISGCKMPCVSSKYNMDILHVRYDWLRFLDKGSDWTVVFWFKNFHAQYDEEYVVCDWTCLIGEVGGSLGFFLGGSVWAYFNFAIDPVIRRTK